MPCRLGCLPMPLRNKLMVLAGLVSSACAAAQSLPPDLPQADGPRGTSLAAPGQQPRFDWVGYADVDASAGPAVMLITAALAAGSFVEITALENGRTVLAIVVAAGAGSGTEMRLAPTTARLLAITGKDGPVRVRQIELSQPDQIALRRGDAASARLDAPTVLLAALRKKLPERPQPGQTGNPLPVPPTGAVTEPPRGPAGLPRKPVVPTLRPLAIGHYAVQIAALSSVARANALAANVGGRVVTGSGLYRIRLGPYADLPAAQKARDAMAAHGYADARIVREP